MKTINERRSVRKYLDKPVEQEKVEALLRAAMQAPSAGNQQPWEFIAIQNSQKLNALAKMSPYSRPIAESALAIVVVAAESRMKFPEYWQQDLAAATQNLLLEATDLGLGAVWLGVAPLEERMRFISELLELTEDSKVFSVVAIGYPVMADSNRFVDRFDPSRIKYL
ncbi:MULTISPECIES: nitroreductase family protein [unclassified Fusibacter]|uniref:nitroreductase family protein n=1 Tax=unclassified Fusibacter TaxID=2624464 RepID=UPI0010119E80|nr:nitroreductase family protein [Fusibacter sp. A1]MCK8058475.1 nitroreductase family protein [Fusibacter sp. A2]NPE22757.1 nitroreductase family protein [Fusibacter sp. A1]RXV60315.1 nitroreductase family protein [Fusibacter sp. A1]